MASIRRIEVSSGTTTHGEVVTQINDALGDVGGVLTTLENTTTETSAALGTLEGTVAEQRKDVDALKAANVEATAANAGKMTPEQVIALAEVSDKAAANAAAITNIKSTTAGLTTQMANKADKTAIPTKVEDLAGHEKYLTAHQDISGKADRTELEDYARQDQMINVAHLSDIPTHVNQLKGTDKFLTAHQDISGKADKTELAAYAKKSDLASKANKTDIPTSVEQLSGTEKFLTKHQDISGKADKAELANYAKQSEVTAELAKKVNAEEGKTLMSEAEHEKLARIEGIITIAEFVEGVTVAAGNTEEHGHLVYDSTANKLLWKVMYNGNPHPTYFAQSTLCPISLGKPALGIVYKCNKDTYISTDKGLIMQGVHNTTGHDPLLPISQNAATKGFEDVQSQIDAIVAGSTKLTVTVAPTPFFEGVSTEVTVTARLVGEQGQITIGSQKSGEKVSVFEVKETITTTKSYTATAMVRGSKVQGNTATANAYKPFYVGAGTAYTVVMVDQYKHGPSSHPRGNYRFKAALEDHVYIIVPNNMTVNSVVFVDGGFGLPVEISKTETFAGYKIYVSSNPCSEGEFYITVK